ncbi:MAG: hypothetical protein MZV63_15735 [Marinilabiliales bacterium]|nr:hypothetical protein [Marinilabiliales bacterium]
MVAELPDALSEEEEGSLEWAVYYHPDSRPQPYALFHDLGDAVSYVAFCATQTMFAYPLAIALQRGRFHNCSNLRKDNTMNVREVIKDAGSIKLDKVTSIHETPTGAIFGCKAKDYACGNKQVSGHIKYPGLCLEFEIRFFEGAQECLISQSII